MEHPYDEDKFDANDTFCDVMIGLVDTLNAPWSPIKGPFTTDSHENTFVCSHGRDWSVRMHKLVSSHPHPAAGNCSNV